MKIITNLLLLMFILNGCQSVLITENSYRHTSTVYAENKSIEGYTKIRMVTNAGGVCSGAIAEYIVGNRMIYRLYCGCSSLNVIKEQFGYCSRGTLLAVQRYEATAEEGVMHVFRLTAWEKLVLNKIDSIRSSTGVREIKGFKKMVTL